MEVENLPKVSSHSIATVERTEDDRSWMELSFVDDDDGNEFAVHSTAKINQPPESVSLDALAIDDDISVSSGALNDTSTPIEPPKPVEAEAKPASRRRPKKTKTHRKAKSFDDRILMGDVGSITSKKKKKKKDKTSKKTKGDSGEFSVKSKRKTKKRTSGKEPKEDGSGEVLLSGEMSSDDQSLISNESSAHSKSSKRRGLKSLSPVRVRNPLKGALVRQISGRGGGLLSRAKDLKDQLALSDHAPRDRKGIMGTMLYSSFDDEDDSDLEDDLFS